MRRIRSPITTFLSMLLTAGAATTAPLTAQVSVRSGTAEETEPPRESVENPMVIEISLGGGEGRKSFSDPSVHGRTFYDQKAFEVDKAWVPKVTVMKRPGKKAGLRLEVAPTIKTTWYRQDIDVTIAVVQGGSEVRRIFWDDLTIGSDDSWAHKAGIAVAGAGSSSYRVGNLDFTLEEFSKLFAGEEPPVLRITLDSQEADEVAN